MWRRRLLTLISAVSLLPCVAAMATLTSGASINCDLYNTELAKMGVVEEPGKKPTGKKVR